MQFKSFNLKHFHYNYKFHRKNKKLNFFSFKITFFNNKSMFATKKICCVNPSHELQPLTLICLDSACNCESRLACVYCLYEDHREHKSSVCLIRDVENATSPWLVQNWPSNP